MTVALEGSEWSAARPGHTLPPGKTRWPFYRRLSGPQDRSGWAENLVPTGIRSRTVQPVVSRYTYWANRPTIKEPHLVLSVQLRQGHPASTLPSHFFFIYRSSPPVDQGLLIHKVSGSHTTTQQSQKTLLVEWSARRTDLYLTTHNTHNRQTSIPPARFEPMISAGERPQT